jgi:hypothetical protein
VAPESDPGSEDRLYAELWISFISVIRSYAAAHDLARVTGKTQVDYGDDNRLTLTGERKILTLEFEPAAGNGSWAIYEDDPGPERVLERGRFKIGNDSQVELSDRRGKLELEVAAEAFTAKVFEE